MKIDLQFPYSKDFKAGYLNINKEPRRVILLVRHDNTKTSVSYARYLFACHLGHYINDFFEVDHIDDNKMNDNVSNYQLLSKKQNNDKKPKALKLDFICPICGKNFQLAKNRSYKKENPACSRACGGKKSHIIKKINNQ